MSRLRFHSPSGNAEVNGSERHRMGRLVYDLATDMLDIRGDDDIQRLLKLLPPDHYLHAIDHTRTGRLSTWPRSFKTAWIADGSAFTWRGHPLDPLSISLNTALDNGGDPLRLVARFYGQNEIHAWVDGPNRKWLADLIDEALDAKLLRRTLRTAGPFGAPEVELVQGWEAVTTLLRSRDDEPVVTSYSVCDSFPNPGTADFPPSMPDGWVPGWAQDGEGRAEWDGYDEECRAEIWEESASDAWYGQSEPERWALAMAWLRSDPGRLELRPEDWTGYWFGHGLTVLDINAPDMEQRLDKAFNLASATSAS